MLLRLSNAQRFSLAQFYIYYNVQHFYEIHTSSQYKLIQIKQRLAEGSRSQLVDVEIAYLHCVVSQPIQIGK